MMYAYIIIVGCTHVQWQSVTKYGSDVLSICLQLDDTYMYILNFKTFQQILYLNTIIWQAPPVGQP